MSVEAVKGLFVFVLGSVVGSFLGVCIHRMPQGLSVVRPGSRCPQCGAAIRLYDNVPLVSFLLLGGRCRACERPISWAHPAVELLTAGLFLALYLWVGWTWTLIRLSVLAAVLIPVSAMDLRHGIVPNQITYPAMAIGLLLGFWGGWGGALAAAVGLLVGGGVLYGTGLLGSALFRRESLGGGDVKLLAAIGTFLGWQGALWTLFLGALIALPGGIALMRFRRQDLRSPIPFGPFLCLGALAYVVLERLGLLADLLLAAGPW